MFFLCAPPILHSHLSERLKGHNGKKRYYLIKFRNRLKLLQTAKKSKTTQPESRICLATLLVDFVGPSCIYLVFVRTKQFQEDPITFIL